VLPEPCSAAAPDEDQTVLTLEPACPAATTEVGSPGPQACAAAGRSRRSRRGVVAAVHGRGLEQLDEADTLIFGRVTYEAMVSYWPTQAGEDFDAAIAARMNAIAKIVVSGTPSISPCECDRFGPRHIKSHGVRVWLAWLWSAQLKRGSLRRGGLGWLPGLPERGRPSRSAARRRRT